MEIQQAKLIDFRKNQFDNYYFKICDKKTNAKNIYRNVDISAAIGRKYFIFKINRFFFVLGYAPNIQEGKILFSHPANFLIVQYKTGNLAIYKGKKTNKNKPIFYFDIDNQIIHYDSYEFDIPIQKLPVRYHIRSSDGNFVSISKLLTRPEFAKFCKVSLDSLRNWTESGKLKPNNKSAGGSMFFSKTQIKEIKALVDTRLRKEDCLNRILLAISQFKAGRILHVKYFKMQLQNYNFSQYTTLRRSLNFLIQRGILARVTNGYFIIKKTMRGI